MKTNRFWIEIVALGTVSACALALVIACVGAAGVAIAGRPPSSAAQSNQPPSNQPPLNQPQSTQPSPVVATEPSSPRSRSFEGMVTCSRCGAKHSPDFGRTAVDCSLTCVHGGATFALVDGDKIYMLDGAPDRLKKVAGQRAHIVGVARGNRIKVSSVAAAS
jgi:hypothetical protein